MTRYQCHKQVYAARILSFKYPTCNLVLEGEGYGETIEAEEDSEWMMKNNPAVGGYYVLYDDGYASYSPKDVFEKGYTEIAFGKL